MGFQRSVWGCVGRKRLEAKPAIYSRSVVLMVVFPYAEECWCWFFFFPPFFFCSLQKDCFGLGSNRPAPKEHFQGTLMAQTMCLFSCLMTTAFKFLLPFKLSAVCLGSEEVTASFALMHSVCGSLR